MTVTNAKVLTLAAFAASALTMCRPAAELENSGTAAVLQSNVTVPDEICLTQIVNGGVNVGAGAPGNITAAMIIDDRTSPHPAGSTQSGSLAATGGFAGAGLQSWDGCVGNNVANNQINGYSGVNPLFNTPTTPFLNPNTTLPSAIPNNYNYNNVFNGPTPYNSGYAGINGVGHTWLMGPLMTCVQGNGQSMALPPGVSGAVGALAAWTCTGAAMQVYTVDPATQQRVVAQAPAPLQATLSYGISQLAALGNNGLPGVAPGVVPPAAGASVAVLAIGTDRVLYDCHTGGFSGTVLCTLRSPGAIAAAGGVAPVNQRIACTLDLGGHLTLTADGSGAMTGGDDLGNRWRCLQPQQAGVNVAVLNPSEFLECASQGSDHSMGILTAGGPGGFASSGLPIGANGVNNGYIGGAYGGGANGLPANALSVASGVGLTAQVREAIDPRSRTIGGGSCSAI